MLAGGVRQFLDAVASRPDTWRVILLPLEGTPAIVRDHVETNRARTLEQVQGSFAGRSSARHVRQSLSAELPARAMQSLAEEAGRMVATDGARYSPERYETFVRAVVRALGAAARRSVP